MRRLVVIPLACVGLLMPGSGASAYPAPSLTRVVTVSRTGDAPNNHTWQSVISPTGRYIAFYSTATDLTEDPTAEGAGGHIFFQDLERGTIERITPDLFLPLIPKSDGIDPAARDISADGRYLVLTSGVPLTPDAPQGIHVYLFDRHTRTFRWLTRNPAGRYAAKLGINLNAKISRDGRYVVFYSEIAHVPEDTNGAMDVYSYGVESDTLERVSVTSSGSQIARSGDQTYSATMLWTLDVSDDGRFVAFMSDAPELVPVRAGYNFHVFVRDTLAGQTVMADLNNNAQPRTSHVTCRTAVMSGDGRYVAFEAIGNAAGTQEGLPGGAPQNGFFVRDLVAGRTERISVMSDGTTMEAYHNFSPPAQWGTSVPQCDFSALGISRDGRHVLFQARRYYHGDELQPSVVALRDRLTETTQLLGNLIGPILADDGGSVMSLVGGSGPMNEQPPIEDPLRVAVTEVGGGVRVMDMAVTPIGDDRLSVQGLASFPGAILQTASDPATDGVSVGPLKAADIGSEIVGASVLSRPELEDLYFRVDFACHTSVPQVVPDNTLVPDNSPCNWPAHQGHAGAVYSLSFTTHDTQYRIEVECLEYCGPPLRSRTAFGLITVPTPRASFELFRCDGSCTSVRQLSGGFNTTAPATITISVPQTSVGVGPGDGLGDIAFRAEQVGGVAATIVDDLTLPNTSIPDRVVTLGIAPAGTSPDSVEFSTPATLDGAGFSGTLDLAGGTGEYEVWARACYADSCSHSVIALEEGR